MAKNKKTTSPLRILVLHRGWVIVGRVKTSATELEISNAAVVRRWGTTGGLGQLARDGVRTDTVLDDSPVIRVHPLAVIKQIDCTESAWTR